MSDTCTAATSQCVGCKTCDDDDSDICDMAQSLKSALTKSEDAASSLRKSFVASLLGSATASLLLNPVSVIKIALQRPPSQSLLPATAAAETTATAVSTSRFRTVIRDVLKNRGVLGFWAGTRISLIQSVPNTVFYMTVYEAIKLHISTLTSSSHTSSSSSSSSYDRRLHELSPAIAGGLARAVALSIVAPLELVRTIQAGASSSSSSTTLSISMSSISSSSSSSSASSSSSSMDLLRSIYRTEGLRGLYRGWSPTLVRDVPYSALYWYCFEMFRPIYSSLLTQHDNNNNNMTTDSNHNLNNLNTSSSTMTYNSSSTTISSSSSSSSTPTSMHLNSVNLLSGATAALIAAIVTHPFDVLKTQNQLQASIDNTSTIHTSTITSSSSTTSTTTTPASTTAASTTEASTTTATTRVSSRSIMGGLRELIRTNRLFSGLSMRLAIVMPASALMVTVYEGVKRLDF